MTKRTFQPNNRRRARKHGFRARMRTRAGRAILSARRGKNRAELSAWTSVQGRRAPCCPVTVASARPRSSVTSVAPAPARVGAPSW